MLFFSRKKLKEECNDCINKIKGSINCLMIGAEKILVSEKLVKNLGVWLDSKLPMDAHITKPCSAAFYYLYNIRRIRRYLSKESTDSCVYLIKTGLL